MQTPRLTLKEQKIFTFEEMHAQMAHAATSKVHANGLDHSGQTPSSTNWNSFMPMLSVTHIYQETMNL